MGVRNKTIKVNEIDINYHKNSFNSKGIILGDIFEKIDLIKDESIDLVVTDPPYNLRKTYSKTVFNKKQNDEYCVFTRKWLDAIKPKLKNNASIYICSDWQTSILIAPILEEYFTVKNRITWQREKGRGSKTNWKNGHEDIWFCVMNKNDYIFNVDDVKLMKKVIAPYKDSEGKAKDWESGENGNYRFTYPSNFMGDITIPFWSMSENTEHPTQKPEKLMAKLILASSNKGDLILDPFLGSGTTLITSKKLGRECVGIEKEIEYATFASIRYDMSELNNCIQGYDNGIFYERNQ